MFGIKLLGTIAGNLIYLEILMTGKWIWLWPFVIPYRKKGSPLIKTRSLGRAQQTVSFLSMMPSKTKSECVPLFLVKGICVTRVPTKAAFFAWEVDWGKVLTLDKLQRRG